MAKRTNTATWLEKYQRWQIKVQKDGIRRTFTSSTPGRNGQRECNRQADAWLDDDIVNTKTKISVIYKKWIEELKTRTGTANVKQYTSYFDNWIEPSIGNVQIEKLSEQHLQDIINKAYKKGLAKKTLQNMKACMLAFLKYCRKCKYTTMFSENIVIPKNAPKAERFILQPEHLKTLFTSTKSTFYGNIVEDFYIHAYRFAAASGLRPGELIGLEWTDVENDVVYLKRSINTDNETTTGKNENAKRHFALTDLQKSILADQKAMLKKNKILSKHIFCTIYGTHIKEKHLYDRWIAYQKHNDIPPCSLYEIRHTFVSITKTLPVGLIKPLVGHSQAMDTHGTYSHQMTGELQTTANLIQDIFDKIIEVG